MIIRSDCTTASQSRSLANLIVVFVRKSAKNGAEGSPVTRRNDKAMLIIGFHKALGIVSPIICSTRIIDNLFTDGMHQIWKSLNRLIPNLIRKKKK